MKAIRAGLDRILNKENLNYTIIADWVLKPANDALNAHFVELAREGKISSTKHKPAMIPRDVEILYEKKQLVLPSSSKFNPQRLSATLLLAPFKVKLPAKKAPRRKSSKTNRWRRFRLQVQPRPLHRSFSAGRFHNRNFNIKYCSNWTRGKRTRTAKCRLFRSRRFAHFTECDVNNFWLWSCPRKIRRLYLAFVFHGIKKVFSFKMSYFFLKHMLLTEAKSEYWKTWKFWKPIDKLWHGWHMTDWQILRSLPRSRF